MFYSPHAKIVGGYLMSPLPRIWVTGMWGFTPETHGYIGFTKEGARTHYIRESEPGDLMMIVGQRSEYTEKRDVGRVLGLVELDPTPVLDTDKMSQESYREKVARGWKDRWTHAMPIIRAWRIGREVKAKHIAPVTCAANNARAIGGNALLLRPEEVAKTLSLPSRKVSIYGREDWVADGADDPEVIAQIAVSHGPSPALGSRSQVLTDGENYVYVMELQGPIASIFHKRALYQMKVIKVGRTNDTEQRERELNFGFPPGCDVMWKVRYRQSFRCADDAHKAEQQLLSMLEARQWAIGKEFAIIPERELAGLLPKIAGSSAFVIRA